MIQVRKAEDRGHAEHGWLEAYHTFSFADYQDEEFMGFRDLRVINEDRVQPGEGFGTHPHRDMEIITYVLEGELEHKDSMGFGSVLRHGDVQRMSAGRGVTHSEFNHSQDKLLHLLQIWILPQERGIKPGYEEKKFPLDEGKNRLKTLVSPTGEQGSLRIHQDTTLYSAVLDEGKGFDFELKPGRHAWAQVANGSVTINGTTLTAGDGAAISDETKLKLVAKSAAEVLLFDLK